MQERYPKKIRLLYEVIFYLFDRSSFPVIRKNRETLQILFLLFP